MTPGALCPEGADPFSELAAVLELPPDPLSPLQDAEHRCRTIARTIAESSASAWSN